MDTKERRALLVDKLKTSGCSVTGAVLAKELGVSRQVIVGDIAILRAAGLGIYATPQGYVLPMAKAQVAIHAKLACKHDREGLANELAIIIDHGGKVLDVVVEHPLYGEIKANLMLTSRYELADFLQRLDGSGAEPLSIITGGVHLHTIEVSSHETLLCIKRELRKHGILIN